MKTPLLALMRLAALLPCFISGNLSAQCNGDSALCARRFDEVCYVTTHNAFNYQGAFILPNQSFDVARQLQDGVRGLMLDVYWLNNQPTVYHGNSFLGNQPLGGILVDIKDFLQANPNEVVSIIFESYITAAQMNDVFNQSGLLPYVHSQVLGQPWPTLQDMITADKRLVVFSDVNDGQAYPWYHYVWDHAVETHYTANSRLDFSCNFNRGSAANSLFILNHFVTAPTVGTGILDSAAAVNANPYLTDRAMDCWAATGKRPNFLTVDFYEQGDVMSAKDAINAGSVGISAPEAIQPGFQVGPNPVKDDLTIRANRGVDEPATLRVVDMQGRVVFQTQFSLAGGEVKLDLPGALEDGIYVFEIQTAGRLESGKLVIARK